MKITMVHMMNESIERKSLWVDLIIIDNTMQRPWVVMGDSNNVLNMEERAGSRVMFAEIRDFKQCVKTSHDLKSSGSYVTWTNKQQERQGF